MYPCEDCGFQGQDVKSLKVHISESHTNRSDENNLEQLGIQQLPFYSRRIKQNFKGLLIDEEGSIEVEESDEEFEMKEIETVVNYSRKRKVTERLQTNKRPKVSQIKEKKNLFVSLLIVVKHSLQILNCKDIHLEFMKVLSHSNVIGVTKLFHKCIK